MVDNFEGIFTAQKILRGIDISLCWLRGIVAFSDDPDCILRIQVEKATHPLHLPSIRVEKGDPIIHLHIWNEHLPRRSDDSQDLAWAARTWRMFLQSLQQLAAAIPHDPRLSSASALGGATALFSLRSGPSSGARLMQKVGFSVTPYYRPWGRFGEWIENTYSWWLIWAYNPTAIHNRKFRRMERTEIWISVTDLLERFSGPPVGQTRPRSGHQSAPTAS